MAIDPELLENIRAYLVQVAGGYLRNTVREPYVTCVVCTTPSPGYARCYPCNSHFSTWRERLADAVGCLVYAVGGRQSGYVMRGYKATPPVSEHVDIVTLLCFAGLALHTSCAARLVGAPVTHWTTVPSLPAKLGDHPMRRLVARVAQGSEVVLTATPGIIASPRDVDPLHFSASAELPAGSHVLVLDDTWTGCGHAQSAVLALRAAGAQHVSVLVVARWINEGYGDNAAFVRDRLTRDYDTRLCPWTGGDCS